MAYSTGMMDKRVTVLNRRASGEDEFGVKAGEFYPVATIWAAVDWSRGVKSMREGAFDAYDTIMVRCRWNSRLTRESRIEWDNKVYQIESFHGDKRENTIQLTAVELQITE